MKQEPNPMFYAAKPSAFANKSSINFYMDNKSH